MGVFLAKFIRNAKSSCARISFPSPRRHFLNTCIRFEDFHIPLNSYSFQILYYVFLCLLSIAFITWNLCSWECYGQTLVWKVPQHSRPFISEVLGADGKSHGLGLKISLFGLL